MRRAAFLGRYGGQQYTTVKKMTDLDQRLYYRCLVEILNAERSPDPNTEYERERNLTRAAAIAAKDFHPPELSPPSTGRAAK